MKLLRGRIHLNSARVVPVKLDNQPGHPSASRRIFFDNRWQGSGGIGSLATTCTSNSANPIATICEMLNWRVRRTDPLDPFRLANYLRRQHADLYISPGYNVPFGSPCETIVTVHDLIHLQDARQSSLAKRLYYHWLVAPSVRNAAVTLTVSQHSRHTISERFGVSRDQIVVVGNGIDERFRPANDEHPAPSRTPYYLYVGNTKPHKNLPVLVAAFADSRLSKFDLVIASHPIPTLLELVQRYQLKNRVRWRPNLEDGDLIRLYQHATATVLPSLMEGFGLPIVEAMACGCPIIGSDRGAIPEIMGDAGIGFSADDSHSLATAMFAVASDPLRRRDLIERGLCRAKQYAWSEVGDRAAEAIQTRLRPTDSNRELHRAA